MTARDRIGFDSGPAKLEDSLAWAAANGFRYIDFNADRPANDFRHWSDERVRGVRQLCERSGIALGLHTLSAVNISEFSPFLSEAADEYLKGNIDLAVRLGCETVEVHAGYHFSSLVAERMQASMERLKRATDYAEKAGMQLLLENLNFEPYDAEVHYLAHTVQECRYYFDNIPSSTLGWAFTINHANLVPEGIDGFLDAFGASRIGLIRLADNNGDKEEHLLPGEGNIDFAKAFQRIESLGYTGHYTMALGTPEEKLQAREFFAGLL